MKRQRILYLNAVSRSMRATVVGFDDHETVESDAPQIEAGVEMPYETVHGAILDGWRVVSFPSPKESALTDDDLTLLGYEFILEKLEQCDD